MTREHPPARKSSGEPPICALRDDFHPRARKSRRHRSICALSDPENGGRQYRRRQQIIEPVFAQTKPHRGITRVWRRGKTGVQAEIDLIAATHNLLKLRTALTAG